MRPDIKILSVPETSFGYAKCQCPRCGKTWNATYSNLTNRLLMTGCPKCRQSKGEQKIETILKKYNIPYETQKTFDDCRDIRPLPFDFYIPDKNIIIEYDGEFHYEIKSFEKHEPQNISIDRLNKTKTHDKIKDEYCLKNKINLIRIPYWEKSNIENIILKEIV